MKTIEQIGVHELKEHIIKNWMTHDGMWFFHCLQSLGIEETNRINKAAIKSLADIEFKRAVKLFGIQAVNTLEGLREAIDVAFIVSKGDFMDFTYSFPEENLLYWEWHGNTCFAYQGMQRMGRIESYQCGVIYRVLCWMESAGAHCTVIPEFEGCLMHRQGKCAGKIRFAFT